MENINKLGEIAKKYGFQLISKGEPGFEEIPELDPSEIMKCLTPCFDENGESIIFNDIVKEATFKFNINKKVCYTLNDNYLSSLAS